MEAGIRKPLTKAAVRGIATKPGSVYPKQPFAAGEISVPVHPKRHDERKLCRNYWSRAGSTDFLPPRVAAT